MDDSILYPIKRFESSTNQVLAALDQDERRHHLVLNCQILASEEMRIRYRRQKEINFDFLESNIDERLEHFDLFVDVHGNR